MRNLFCAACRAVGPEDTPERWNLGFFVEAGQLLVGLLEVRRLYHDLAPALQNPLQSAQQELAVDVVEMLDHSGPCR
jgi:hypothetical protein